MIFIFSILLICGSTYAKDDLIIDDVKKNASFESFKKLLSRPSTRIQVLRWFTNVLMYKADPKLEEIFQNAEKSPLLFKAAWNSFGWYFYKATRYQEMREAFKKAIQYRQDPNPWDQIGLGIANYFLGEYSVAESHFKKALDMKDFEKSKLNAKLWLGYTYFVKGDKYNAINYLEEYINSQPFRHISIRIIRNFLRDQGTDIESTAFLNKITGFGQDWSKNDVGVNSLKGQPLHVFEKAIQYQENLGPWDHNGLGKAYYHMGGFSFAEKHFQESLNMDDDGGSQLYAKLWLGYTYYQNGNNEAANRCFNDYMTKNNDEMHMASRLIGRYLYEEEDYELAEKYLNKAIALNTEYASSWNNLGWVYKKTQRYPEMKQAFQNAIIYRTSPWDYLGLGESYYYLEDYELAENNFKYVLEEMNNVKKSHLNATLWLGYTFYKKGDERRAEEFFNEYIRKHDKRYISKRLVGRFYYNQAVFDKAETIFKEAIEEKEDYGNVWNNLGWLYKRTERYSKMREAFEKAIRYRKKSNPWDLIGLGEANFFLKHYNQAEENFKEALQMKSSPRSHFYANLGLGYIHHIKGNEKEAKEFFSRAGSLWSTNQKLGIKTQLKRDGILILLVRKASVSHLCGLKVGDIITHMNGDKITKRYQFIEKMHLTKYGDAIEVSIKRGDRHFSKKILLDFEHYVSKGITF